MKSSEDCLILKVSCSCGFEIERFFVDFTARILLPFENG